MFLALLLLALALLVFGLLTTLKWLIIIAVVVALLSLVVGFVPGRRGVR